MNQVGIRIGIPMEHLVNPRGMMTIGGTMIDMMMIMVGAIQGPLGRIVNQGMIMIAQSVIAHLVDHEVACEMLTIDPRKQEHRGYGHDRDHYRIIGKNKETVKEDGKNKEEVLKNRNGKEIEKEALVETREKRRGLFSSSGPNVDNPGDAKPSSATKEPLDSSAVTVDGVNAAKVAAMKAAELVNRNIAAFGAGTGRLSTDQKKKLLWGNKKSNPSDETSKRWDSNLFSDRERQEKFNKLMGVKSSAPVQENKVENMDGSSAEAKKLEELDTNLEKHYIAGLRRRDGRTVGLGL